MIIDCDTCRVRGPACGDCVVTVLLGRPGQAPDLDAAEQRAIGVLAAGGLVPPLRLVPDGVPAGRPPLGPVPPPEADDAAGRNRPPGGAAAYDRGRDDGSARAG
jgi:hypothetical protein